jgi:hypothetical protein
MLRLTRAACALAILAAARPAYAQRLGDPPQGEVEPAWAAGVLFGAVAAAGLHSASPTLRGVGVGASISAGVGLGVALGHRLSHHDGSPSVVWPIVGAAVVAVPLTLSSDCGKRDGNCGWDVLLAPAVSALGALIAHRLSRH